MTKTLESAEANRRINNIDNKELDSNFIVESFRINNGILEFRKIDENSYNQIYNIEELYNKSEEEIRNNLIYNNEEILNTIYEIKHTIDTYYNGNEWKLKKRYKDNKLYELYIPVNFNKLDDITILKIRNDKGKIKDEIYNFDIKLSKLKTYDIYVKSLEDKSIFINYNNIDMSKDYKEYYKYIVNILSSSIIVSYSIVFIFSILLSTYIIINQNNLTILIDNIFLLLNNLLFIDLLLIVMVSDIFPPLNDNSNKDKSRQPIGIQLLSTVDVDYILSLYLIKLPFKHMNKVIVNMYNIYEVYKDDLYKIN